MDWFLPWFVVAGEKKVKQVTVNIHMYAELLDEPEPLLQDYECERSASPMEHDALGSSVC